MNRAECFRPGTCRISPERIEEMTARSIGRRDELLYEPPVVRTHYCEGRPMDGDRVLAPGSKLSRPMVDVAAMLLPSGEIGWTFGQIRRAFSDVRVEAMKSRLQTLAAKGVLLTTTGARGARSYRVAPAWRASIVEQAKTSK